jgi:hypothetical protein
MTRAYRRAALLISIYRAAARPLRRQIWMTNAIVGLVAVAGLSGQTVSPQAESAWWTPQNIISLGILIYGVGVTVQQSRGVAERLKKLEEDIPNTYVRKDVFEVRLGRRDGDPVVRRLD